MHGAGSLLHDSSDFLMIKFNNMIQHPDWELVNACLLRLYKELDIDSHSRVMLEVINELVPSDSIALQKASMQNPTEFSAVTLPEVHTTKEQQALIIKYAHQSPFTPYFLATLDPRWKKVTDFIPFDEFQKTEIYRLALSPIGIKHQLFCFLGVFNGTLHAFVTNRADKEFTERDREVLNLIHPHLLNSFINACAYSNAQNSIQQMRAAMETAPGAFGYFNQQGQLVWLQKRAEEWLKAFFSNETWVDEKVPHTVRQMINRSAQENNSPQQIEKNNTTERLTICLGASPVGGWVIRLERFPLIPPSHFRPLPQLSDRKNEVLKWMVEGKRNAEIATILNLSTRTVENHVQEILRELMVENRATAIVRVMEYCAAANIGRAQC